jgi:hypothetical protein
MRAEVLVSLITGVVTAVVTLLSVRFRNEWEIRRSRESKEELGQELMARYREPLVRAAFDLQSRIYNIVAQSFLLDFYVHGSPAEQEYAVRNTLFVFADYLGWVEIMRQDVQFLDLGDVERNHELACRLEAVTDILADSRTIKDPAFRLFKGQQRALGEVMIESVEAKDGSPRGRCMGYARFVAKLETEPAFARWFEQLEGDVQDNPEDPKAHAERLTPLQHALMDLIDFLDDPPVRFPPDQRGKLAA